MALSIKEIEHPASQLADICKTVGSLPGVISIRSYGGEHRVHMQFNNLLNLSHNLTYKNTGDEDYPIEASITIKNVAFVTLIEKEEWLDFAKANHHCPECGLEKVHHKEEGVILRICPKHCVDEEYVSMA